LRSQAPEHGPPAASGATLYLLVLAGEALVMTRPGEETAADKVARDHLRASHADREQVIGILKAAFVQGMLAKDQLDARVGQALTSQTYAGLAAITADLPTGLAAAKPLLPARSHSGQKVLRPGPVIMVTTALYAGVWPFLVLWPSNSEGDTPPPVGLLFSSTTSIYLVVLAVALGYMVAGWRQKRSGGQPPRRPGPGARGQASRRLPSAGPGRQLPPADPGQQQTAEAAPSRRPRPLLPVWRARISMPGVR